MTFSENDVVVRRPNKVVYHVGDDLIKVYEPGHPKSGVFNEALITSIVEGCGVKASAVRAVGQIDGKWAITLEYVEGRTIEELIAEEPEKADGYLKRFVEIQIEVTNHRAFGLRNTIDKKTAEIRSMEGIDPSTRFELLQRLNGMHRHTKLCHGDFVPSNVVILPDGDYRVIDWAHATQGNAGADAALTYLRFSLKDEDAADRYLRLYSEMSGTPVRYIQKWMPIMAAGQLTKGVPEEKELLEKWVSVAEYQ